MWKEEVFGVIGFIGFVLYLYNYYVQYAIIPLLLLILFRNKKIPVGRRVAVNVSAGIIAPLTMIYPMLKHVHEHGFTINHDFLTFLGLTVLYILIFSGVTKNYSFTGLFAPLFAGNTAVYCRVSPTIALPIVFLLTLLIGDGIYLLILLRRTPKSIKFTIGGLGLWDGLIAVPGLTFLSILYVVLYMYYTPIIPAHYLFIKKGLYS